MNNAIADQIKEMLVENLRIPENILTYDSEPVSYTHLTLPTT